MKRKLNNDEIDDLLDEIKDCTRKFFDNKRQRAEIAAITVQPQMLTAPNEVVSVPPPPLQRHPHISPDNGPEGAGDMLIECYATLLQQYGVCHRSWSPNLHETQLRLA